jgi:hypothetical protein
MSEW